MKYFGQIGYLKISQQQHVQTLTVSSISMPGWVGASKNNLASVILQSTTKISKVLTSGMLGESFHFVDQNKNAAR